MKTPLLKKQIVKIFQKYGLSKDHAIISTKLGVPAYQVAQAKKDRRAAMRNAKIRLYNIKPSEIINVMRGKAKQIKK